MIFDNDTLEMDIDDLINAAVGRESMVAYEAARERYDGFEEVFGAEAWVSYRRD